MGELGAGGTRTLVVSSGADLIIKVWRASRTGIAKIPWQQGIQNRWEQKGRCLGQSVAKECLTTGKWILRRDSAGPGVFLEELMLPDF